MKISKMIIVSGLISIILIVLTSLIYFLIPNANVGSESFWITYGFSILFIVLAFGSVWFSFYGKKDLKSRIVGVPIVYVGLVGVLVQLIFDGIVLLTGIFPSIPYLVTVLIEILILGIVSISMISRTAYRDAIISVDKKDMKESFFKNLKVELALLKEKAKNDALKKALIELLEQVQFGDPVSNEEAEGIEDSISSRVETLSNTMETNANDALILVDQISQLVKERQLRIKSSK